MSPLRYRDDESSSTSTVLGVVVGAVAGFAVGMLVAQRVGGFGALTSKLRRKGAAAHNGSAPRPASADEDDEFDDIEEDELESDDADETLEERVLEAFRNDPILCERAVDIGSLNAGVIELAGWVEDESESEHAVTIARGVPGVDTVINRIALGDDERRFDEAARRTRDGDPALTETQWEGGRIGMGRRRQGNSSEPDRHASPRADLEERWSQVDDAVRNAADDTDGLAERRTPPKRGARSVPKADHVIQPPEASD